MNHNLNPKSMPLSGGRNETDSPWDYIALILLILVFMGAALYHIYAQPLPNQWDDSVYATATYQWLDFIHWRGDLLRGIFWGAVYEIPHHLPPMVFITSLLGALVGGETLLSMRLAHLVWFLVLLLCAYGVGVRLGGRRAGILSVFMTGIVPLVFFWSKMIMGEPALFAAVGLLLLALVYWGNRPNLFTGAVIGGITGFGMLTKQHFPISAAGPLALWGLWLGIRFFKAREERKKIILTLVGAALVFLAVAAPWYVISYKEMLAYASQPAFPLHTLEGLPFLSGAALYLRVLISNNGWPVLLVLLLGLIWSIVLLARSFPRLVQNYSLFGIAMLAAAGIINLGVGFGMRNINPRFIVPSFIPLAVLAGMGLAALWQRGKGWRWVVSGVILLQAIFWWSLNFGPDLPRFITFVEMDPDLRPTDMTLSKKTFDTLEGEMEGSATLNLWVVGNYYSFNQPTFENMAREKVYSWEVQELYHWAETEAGVDALLPKIQSGDWVAIYRQERAFDFQGEALVSRLDDQILERLLNDPDFNLVQNYTANLSRDDVHIFQRIDD